MRNEKLARPVINTSGSLVMIIAPAAAGYFNLLIYEGGIDPLGLETER